ncbi:unnamed protein product [Dovyalis caffra]|uniref:Uncharacterized protein n=1 Tax=Dovyalis caffra TaxID=77055 RepID=A0AAV1RJU9_9ROSI|nr:unnamed protein product [Dovyalis caffra]
MRHLKAQQDLREKEFEKLRIAFHSACTDLGSAVTTAGNAFINKGPPVEKRIENLLTEKDPFTAELSGGRIFKFVSKKKPQPKTQTNRQWNKLLWMSQKLT